MQITKGAILELLISDLAFEGPGIAKIKIKNEDFVVFVDDVAPGDLVEVEIIKLKKNYAVGRKIRIIKLSTRRILPRCKHFSVCGGCTWQFLAYDDQLKFKENFVCDALERIGGIMDPPIAPILRCENPWFYRNKMEYTFSDGPGGLRIGFHQRKRFAEIFDIEECFLESGTSVKIAQWVKQWAQTEGLTAYDPQRKTGFLRNLIVREALSSGERLVNLFTASDNFPATEKFSQEIPAAFPGEITSLLWTIVKIQKGFRTIIEERHLWGKNGLREVLRVMVSGSAPGSAPGNDTIALSFDIAPQAFFQPNSRQAEILYGEVLKAAAPKPDDVVFDLFCGTGTIGMFFAKICRRVYGIEFNEAALISARLNAEKNNLSNIEFLCGDVGKMMKEISEPPNIIVIDPPRAGLSNKSVEKILESRPEKIIYVSCNPSTFARDAKIISQNYDLVSVQPVDMFPQTYHVETVASFLDKKNK